MSIARRTMLVLMPLSAGFAASAVRGALRNGAPSSAGETADDATAAIGADDWTGWRGPTRDGIASIAELPVDEWSAERNVVWRAEIPGTGHGSPIVVGDQVIVATADLEGQRQSLVSLDRHDGTIRWTCTVHEEGLKKEGNAKASLASSTPCFDGERFYVNFLNAGGIVTSAIDPSGSLVWQQRICDYVVHQGYGGSPAIYGDLVLVTADNKGGGAVAGLDRRTGEIVWKFARPAKPNYASPIVHHLDGRDQLTLIGCDEVVALDPNDGSVLWRCEGATTECVTTPVTDGTHLFTSGGYPRNHVSAIVADGSGRVAWENGVRVYVPSMIVRDGHLYAMADEGIAFCWHAATGEERWKKRIGGTFSGSPVLVGDRMVTTDEEGRTTILAVSPDGCEIVSRNELGNRAYASPAICADGIYLRTTELIDGNERDVVYRIGD
ncbi:MAG TPA: PQQ-binding-like beta-propeller repeat protein [Pirellulaceae bacterium]|nr:PQQ-binding-like beta-propeller repeat protein [Pirellulaceae bacterium]